MNPLALDTALIGRLDEEALQEEWMLQEAQTYPTAGGSENRRELSSKRLL